MSLSGRCERSLQSFVRHFAVVVMIPYPPKVSSEHFIDDVGTPRNCHRNNSKVIYFRKTLARTYRNYSGNFSSRTYARKSLSFMTDDSMTLKTINFSRTAYTRAVREEFQGTAVIVSSVIAFLYPFTISIKSFNIPSLLFKCKDTKFLSQIQIFQGKSDLHIDSTIFTAIFTAI